MKIDLTVAAKEQILKENIYKKYVRLYVKYASWTGPNFALSLEETQKDTDVLKEIEGIKFVVDEYLDKTYKNVGVDYGTKFFRQGYIIGLQDGESGGCS